MGNVSTTPCAMSKWAQPEVTPTLEFIVDVSTGLTTYGKRWFRWWFNGIDVKLAFVTLLFLV